MEQPGMRVVRPANEYGNMSPNHLIIWLDKHIGQTGQCVLLKRSFFTTADPSTGAYEMDLDRSDIDRSILSREAVPIQLDEVQFMLRAFDNVETCFEAIENNLDKRIFFITSGSKGRIIVPSLVANFPDKFLPEQWMYVFCAKMNMISTEGAGNPTNTWALNYIEHILMFNHQDDLLARLVLEIADYFFTEAQRLDNDQQLYNAIQHYRWSKQMYLRYETMEKKRKTAKIQEINQCINNAEERRNQQMNDDPMGEPPS